MKKKTFYFVWVILALFLGTVFGEEPDSFRGIKWGTNKSKIDGLACNEGKKDKQACARKEEKKVGDIEVKAIVYIFYKAQFCGAMIDFEGSSNFTFLRDALIQKYGPGERPNQFLKEYIWRFENVIISIKYSEIKRDGTIFYGYHPILNQEKFDRKERGRKAKDDL